MGGLDPVETFEWVRRRAGELFTLGNHDDYALMVGPKEGPNPPYTEAGAYQRLSAEQLEDFKSYSGMLELLWRGKRIRVMHGHFTPSGECTPFPIKPSEQTRLFADPEMDLTIVAHSHYPYVAEQDGTMVANSGSTAGLFIGARQGDGTVLPMGEEPEFIPPAQIYSTYLLLSTQGCELNVSVERFDYDRAAVIERLREAGDRGVEGKRDWLMKAIG
jgi:predicted phosphodiesterase